MRVRIDLAYDGSDFHGWAVQPGLRTVQGSLADALAMILRLPAPPELVVAGRTDAGVHARGQVAHVDLPMSALTPHDDGWLAQRLNSALPADVRILSAVLAPAGFEARFAALWRAYSYRIDDRRFGPDPLRRHVVAQHRRPLSVDAMQEAAQSLVGEHDFIAFAKPREGATTIRTVESFSVSRESTGLVLCRVKADAFCHHQVRFMVGALLAVGDGRRSVEWVGETLRAGRRDAGVELAAPHALVFDAVGYPPDHDLAARALLTRAVRTLSSTATDPASPASPASPAEPAESDDPVEDLNE